MRSESPISEEEADRRRQEALGLLPDDDIQSSFTEGVVTNLVAGANWDSLDSGDSNSTPPDPELARFLAPAIGAVIGRG